MSSPRKDPESRTNDPLQIIDQILAITPQDDPRYPMIYALRKKILEESLTVQQTQVGLKKLNSVIEKVTAPANRIGTFLGFPDEKFAHIVVGGSDYYTNIDPRLKGEELQIGARILVNDAFAVIKSIGYDPGGPLMKITDLLPDGRLRAGQDAGTQSSLLIRSSQLAKETLKVGEEVRVDPNHRVGIEKVASTQQREYFLEEAPKTSWEEIGGQKDAIEAIRQTLESPLLYPDLFKKFNFSPPKGFLLYGPPGCGKTLIGKAVANTLVQKLKTDGQEKVEEFFLHVKGPEILNMWLGESERMVRDIFSKAREKRGAGFLPFIFIDEAESILGTRRSNRSHNILSTLVPMFCAEMDGIESLHDTVIILASNRPDLIDPAVLRPGRIDRKIKVRRPDRQGTEDIFKIYLNDRIPLAPSFIQSHGNDPVKARHSLIESTVEAIFSKGPDQQFLDLHLRSGRRQVLYKSDLISGALIASIVQRSKEKAIKRAIAGEEEGITSDNLFSSIQEEYREGEILPPNDIVEDWLKLIDADPENVVGISLLDKEGRYAPKN
ncbi:MAG: AAA family ATPase [Nitrospirae bacterium]|nr:AAA family ATPase [Nitrospirota bacterium]MBI3352596.1 AAA family ATPase [Nitrospirota bacterium]